LREAESEECVVLVGVVRGGREEDRVADHGGHGKTLKSIQVEYSLWWRLGYKLTQRRRCFQMERVTWMEQAALFYTLLLILLHIANCK